MSNARRAKSWRTTVSVWPPSSRTTYDIQESRPWWRVKLIALGLTIALAVFIVVSTGLVMVGPTLAAKVAAWAGLGSAFTTGWQILQWPLVFALVALGIAMIF